MKHLLTIAGSDSSGGAGIQADLKTFSAHGTYGMSVITAITAQNTTGVTAVVDLNPSIIAAQIDAVFSDIRVDAVKIGAAFSTASSLCLSASVSFWLTARRLIAADSGVRWLPRDGHSKRIGRWHGVWRIRGAARARR